MLYKHTTENNAAPTELSVKVLGQPKGEEGRQREGGRQRQRGDATAPPTKSEVEPRCLAPQFT